MTPTTRTRQTPVRDQPETPGLTRRWSPRERPNRPDRPDTPGASVNTPSDSSPGLLDRVLAARGIHPADADAFLNPSLLTLHDPSLIPDLDTAARRILDAAELGEPIVIYGDYDVDGITATAILVHALRAITPNANLHTYIPHRIDEGYGINTPSIARLASEGARLIVSVDCGITAHEPAREARRLGVDLIITDHHNPPATMDDLPRAFAVVHPRRPDSAYPFGDLCGAGVAYKLAWRLATMHAGRDRASQPCREVLVELLGLAALGTLADVVPLIGENRVLVRHGLDRLANPRSDGLRALIRASGLEPGTVDARAVGFRLAPRLNAAGRLGHAREALELLTDARGRRADEIAESLSRVNDERRGIEHDILEQACRMAEASGMTGPDTRAIVLACQGWHPGVLGIVCSRMVEKYARPVLLLQRDGEWCKGSGRAVDGFNLHAALTACSSCLERFGGHDMAAGLACRSDKLESFADLFTAHANSLLPAGHSAPMLRYDTQASINELSQHAVAQLDRIAPFGPGNPPVRLRVRARLLGRPDTLGASGDHLAFRMSDPLDRSHAVRVLAWNWGAHAASIPPGAPVEAVIEPRLSRWNGNTRVEPVLADLRVLGDTGDKHQPYSVGTLANDPARS